MLFLRHANADPALRARIVAAGWVAEGDGPDLVIMCGSK